MNPAPGTPNTKSVGAKNPPWQGIEDRQYASSNYCHVLIKFYVVRAELPAYSREFTATSSRVLSTEGHEHKQTSLWEIWLLLSECTSADDGRGDSLVQGWGQPWGKGDMLMARRCRRMPRCHPLLVTTPVAPAKCQSPASCVQSPLITKINTKLVAAGSSASFWGGRYQPLCLHQHQFSCLLPTPLQTLKAKPQLLVSPQGRIYCHRLFRAVSEQGQGIPRARGVGTKRDEQRQLSCAKRLVHSFRKEGHLCKNVIFSICCFPM